MTRRCERRANALSTSCFAAGRPSSTASPPIKAIDAAASAAKSRQYVVAKATSTTYLSGGANRSVRQDRLSGLNMTRCQSLKYVFQYLLTDSVTVVEEVMRIVVFWSTPLLQVA